MAGKDPYGMSIRLSKDLVETLQKLKKEKDLPSMAAAIKFWVEQTANDKVEARITAVEETVKQLTFLLHQKIVGRILKDQDVYGRFIKSLNPQERIELFEAAQEGGDGWGRKWFPKLKKFAGSIIVEALKKEG